MRLRWEASAPGGVAAMLRAALGEPEEDEGEGEGEGEIVFRNARLEITALQSSGHARPPDRLRILGLAVGKRAADRPSLTVGIATVDADRYAAERGWTSGQLPGDRALGASVRAVTGRAFVLLEPATEGRIAATLARLDEGPAALYLERPEADAALIREALERRAVAVARVDDGPFGPEILLDRRPIFGPHVIVHPARARPPGTIRRR